MSYNLSDIGVSVYNVRNYGAKADGVTDDTAAIQAAINACAANYGGIVYFPWSLNEYIIGGPLITSLNSVNPNCQLYVPLFQIPTVAPFRMASIKLMGGGPPNFFEEGVQGIPKSIAGVVLKSTIQGTGTTPSVFGTPFYAAGVVGNRNYVKVDFENLVIRTTTQSGSTEIVGTMSGINFGYLCCFNHKNIKVDVTSPLTTQVKPTGGTYGIIYPYKNNKSEMTYEGITSVLGYTYGLVPGEHSIFVSANVCGNVNAIYLNGPNQDYAITFMRLSTELNNVNILVNQSIDLTIWQWEIEHYMQTDNWWTFQKDIAYQSGLANVYIFNTTIGISNVGKTANTNYWVVDTNASMLLRVFNGIGKNV